MVGKRARLASDAAALDALEAALAPVHAPLPLSPIPEEDDEGSEDEAQPVKKPRRGRRPMNLSVEERATLTRARNRVHAQSTRRRKRIVAEYVREAVASIVAECPPRRRPDRGPDPGGTRPPLGTPRARPTRRRRRPWPRCSSWTRSA